MRDDENKKQVSLSSVIKLPAVKCVSYVFGIIAAYYVGEWRYIVLLIAAVLVIAAFVFRKLRLSAAALFLGALSMTLYINLYCEPLYKLDGSTVNAEFVITEISSGKNRGFTALGIIEGKPALVNFYGEPARIGDTIKADVTLVRINDNDYYFSEGILLKGNIKNLTVKKNEFSVMRIMDNLRKNIEKRVCKNLYGDAGALARGILFGDKSKIDLMLERNIELSGIAHMTAVSGTHFTLCIMLLTEIIDRKNKIVSAWISIAAILFMAAFYGFSPSVLRAAVMLFICRCAVIVRTDAVTLNSLCCALLIMTVFTPFAAVSPALQMSVLGVFGIGVAGPEIGRQIFLKRKNSAVKFSIAAMVCAAVFTSPVSISLFKGISLTGIVSQILIYPFFMMGMIFGILSAFTGFEIFNFLLGAAMSVIRAIIGVTGGSNIAWLTLDFELAPVFAAICALALSAVVFSEGRFLKSGLSVFAAAASLSVAISILFCTCRKEINFVSDGESGAAVICSGRQAVVVISGDGSGIAHKLYDTLMQNGITEIKSVCAREIDDSGVTALAELSEIYNITKLYIPEDYMESAYEFIPDAEIITGNININVNGTSIACAKAGDTSVKADIVIYYGYKLSVPENSAALALYSSSRQNLLPENGINIYDTNLVIKLK